jgi:NADH-quinone oxidoreductase subunit N
MSILSMILGSVAAIMQTNIKRLMAYSSIGHIGFALMAMASGSETGVSGILYYMSIYLVMNVGVFACIMGMRRKDGMVENISDLAGLAASRPAMAAAIALFMLSLAGIPPLVGFLGKFYVIGAAVEEGHYILSGIAFIASVIGAYYYLRVIKIMYFDEGEPDFIPQKSLTLRAVSFAGAAGVIFMGFPQISEPLKAATIVAAKALLS